MTIGLADLWLPILLAAVGVFVASSVIHMALPIHKGDYAKMPGEEAVMTAMREQGVRPGDYMFPFCESLKDTASPEYLEKCNRGPIAIVHVQPNGPVNIGKNLVQWFVYSVAVGVLVAYLGAHTLAAGADAGSVFRITGCAAVLGYAAGTVPNSIWKGVRWSATAKFVFDGVVYGLVTGAVFAWLWPAAA